LVLVRPVRIPTVTLGKTGGMYSLAVDHPVFPRVTVGILTGLTRTFLTQGR
jgi:hypothetical protein